MRVQKNYEPSGKTFGTEKSSNKIDLHICYMVRSMELNPGKTVENETLVSNDKLMLWMLAHWSDEWLMLETWAVVMFTGY